jgi:hypothetical protein
MVFQIYTLRLRFRSLFRRKRVDEELDAELRYHIERKTEENVVKGMMPEEARPNGDAGNGRAIPLSAHVVVS